MKSFTQITIQDIIDYCESQGFKYEIHGACSYAHRSDDRLEEYFAETDYKIKIGFTKHAGVWYWFEVNHYDYDKVPEMDATVHMESSYSQNTGRTRKGFMYRLDVCEKILKVVDSVEA